MSERIILYKKDLTTVDRNTRRRMQVKSTNLPLETWKSLKARSNETGEPMMRLIQRAWEEFDARIEVKEREPK